MAFQTIHAAIRLTIKSCRVAYDDKDTFKEKIEWGHTKGLGGVLIWSINDDDQDLSALSGVVAAQALVASNTTNDG